jgi:hypothetical protein
MPSFIFCIFAPISLQTIALFYIAMAKLAFFPSFWAVFTANTDRFPSPFSAQKCRQM